MSWLVRDTEVLATLEVASKFVSRARGLAWREDFDGALLLPNTKSVHSFGMKFPLDVAWLDEDNMVIRISSLPVRRVTRAVRKSRHVLEARAGVFREWDLSVGDRLEGK